MSFAVRVNGKAIITGEHAVIRGSPALVFPVSSCALEIQQVDPEGPFRVNSDRSPESKMVLMGVLERALQNVGRTFDDLRGVYRVDSTIPIGAGLGASAALCVAVARFFEHRGWVHHNALFDFSRELENIFHGESSGVDIAVALEGNPIIYSRQSPIQRLNVTNSYWLFVSHCGTKGVTVDCVRAVKDLWARDSLRAESIDREMEQSVLLAQRAFGPEGDVSHMARSFQIARACFKNWGLTQGKLEDHMEALLGAGAIAVKPTGSGGGGHVLSLWKTRPPETTGSFHLLEVMRGS